MQMKPVARQLSASLHEPVPTTTRFSSQMAAQMLLKMRFAWCACIPTATKFSLSTAAITATRLRRLQLPAIHDVGLMNTPTDMSTSSVLISIVQLSGQRARKKNVSARLSILSKSSFLKALQQSAQFSSNLSSELPAYYFRLLVILREYVRSAISTALSGLLMK